MGSGAWFVVVGVSGHSLEPQILALFPPTQTLHPPSGPGLHSAHTSLQASTDGRYYCTQTLAREKHTRPILPGHTPSPTCSTLPTYTMVAIKPSFALPVYSRANKAATAASLHSINAWSVRVLPETSPSGAATFPDRMYDSNWPSGLSASRILPGLSGGKDSRTAVTKPSSHSCAGSCNHETAAAPSQDP